MQACGQENAGINIKIKEETGIVINRFDILAESNSSVNDDYTDYYRLQIDSIELKSAIEQIHQSTYYLDTLVHFPDFHYPFMKQDIRNAETKRWTRAPFGYRYINELQEGGREVVICEVNIELRTISFHYVQE